MTISGGARHLLLTMFAAAAVGCSEGAPKRVEPVPVVTTSAAMPMLREVSWRATLDNSLLGTNHDVIVSERGNVAFGMRNGDQVLTVVDTAGEIIATLGRRGEGPGELRLPLLVGFSDSSITVFDGQLLKLVTFAIPSGEAGRERRFTGTVFPALDAGAHGLLVRTASATGGIVPGLVPHGKSEPEPAIASGDTTFNLMFPPNHDMLTRVVPSVGLWAGGVIVGHGKTYRIALYNWDGSLARLLSRDIVPSLPGPARLEKRLRQSNGWRGPNGERLDPVRLEQERDKARTQPMPFFSHVAPLFTDARGRIWVVGAESDSAFADVFSPADFIGRIPLSCSGFSGRWSLNGEWLALVCEAADDQAVDAVVKLYRIIEPS